MIKIISEQFDLVLSKFSDGTQKIEIKLSDDLKRVLDDSIKCPGMVTISWRFENEAEILTLYYIVSWFRDHFSSLKLYLNLYYVPYARMDRVEDISDVFTLKYFTNLLNSMNFEEVIVLDPHSRVSGALINRVSVVEPESYLYHALNLITEGKTKKAPTILFPDRGAYERYLSPKLRKCFDDFGVTKFLYGEKVRDWKTSNIQTFTVNTRGLVEIDDVLIIDDIITTGGTIEECVKAMDDINAAGKIYVYATFLEKGAFQNQKFAWVLDQCEKVITTETLPLGEYENHPKLERCGLEAHSLWPMLKY